MGQGYLVELRLDLQQFARAFAGEHGALSVHILLQPIVHEARALGNDVEPALRGDRVRRHHGDGDRGKVNVGNRGRRSVYCHRTYPLICAATLLLRNCSATRHSLTHVRQTALI